MKKRQRKKEIVEQESEIDQPEDVSTVEIVEDIVVGNETEEE